jgi:hypothetical protein
VRKQRQLTNPRPIFRAAGLLLSSDEWLRIQQAAQKQFPNETLSRSEVCRRYVLAGNEALKNTSDVGRARLVHLY